MISGNIAGSSGIRVTSSRTTVISGCPAMASVIACEKRSRSTASAAPAGTRCASAARMTSEPSRRISSFSSPTALSSLSPRNELEQTSSARPSVLWTAVGRTGRISWRTTRTPRDAACQAASEPASPPPMMWIIVVRSGLKPDSTTVYAPAALRARGFDPALFAARRLNPPRRGLGAASFRAAK